MRKDLNKLTLDELKKQKELLEEALKKKAKQEAYKKNREKRKLWNEKFDFLPKDKPVHVIVDSSVWTDKPQIKGIKLPLVLSLNHDDVTFRVSKGVDGRAYAVYTITKGRFKNYYFYIFENEFEHECFKNGSFYFQIYKHLGEGDKLNIPCFMALNMERLCLYYSNAKRNHDWLKKDLDIAKALIKAMDKGFQRLGIDVSQYIKEDEEDD